MSQFGLDTAKLTLTSGDVAGVDFIEETTCRLCNITEHTGRGFASVWGDLGNLRVKITPHKIIVENSLCKFAHGDNLQALTMTDTAATIEAISDTLHLPFDRAAVTRLHFGANLQTTHPAGVYYPYLGAMQYANRVEHSNGIQYRRRDITLDFYDKIAESKKNRVRLPPDVGNVLRYEMQLQSRLTSTLKLPRLTAGELHNPAIWRRFVALWLEYYNKIKKQPKMKFEDDISAFDDLREFDRAGRLLMIERWGGQAAALAMVADAQKRGELTKLQASRWRAKINETCKNARDKLIAGSDELDELDGLIKEAAGQSASI